MKAFIVLATALAAFAPVYGRTMDRCSLAKEMHALGVPKSELPTWTCIAEHESSYRTNVVGPPNKDGSRDYGILQINNRYWCKPPNGGKSSNGCKIGCNELLTDNIRTSVKCARKVLSAQGWGAWSTYGKCKGKLPSIDPCFK